MPCGHQQCAIIYLLKSVAQSGFGPSASQRQQLAEAVPYGLLIEHRLW